MSFDKNSLREPRRRKERLELDGGPAWVWEETVAEHLHKLSMAERPPGDPRGGIDLGNAVVWQILYSLYESDKPDSKRLFDESELPLVYQFRREEFDRIMAALGRVNGQSEREAGDWEAFTGASEAAPTSR